jgi:hypothetical protein
VIATVGKLYLVVLCAACASAAFAADNKWASAVPAEQRDALAGRLNDYLKANSSRNWKKLYDLVSNAGRGSSDRKTFVARMTEAHGKDFANDPDLLQFQPARTVNESGYDIYGCAKAQREGRGFNGIALVHAVFEHNEWLFSGWTFTAFPNEPCKALSDPSWEMLGPMNWDRPMEELRVPPGVPFHIDSPKK